ncbi:GNAT family N-acetyltransferase [Streptomyces sp. NPDC005708]|uniref:GNAT family N-acetyltransferase n=1 Tax=Streptomyces sp. NPDC005708 TaxID=3154564 RepID=UPI0034069E4D
MRVDSRTSRSSRRWYSSRASCVVGYLAEVNGVAVGTGLTFRSDDCVGVFHVSVASDHRRRGYGRAVTAAAIRAEQNRGARTTALVPDGARGLRVPGGEAVDTLHLMTVATRKVCTQSTTPARALTRAQVGPGSYASMTSTSCSALPEANEGPAVPAPHWRLAPRLPGTRR